MKLMRMGPFHLIFLTVSILRRPFQITIYLRVILVLTLNHGYTPDIARDSIMNDYHFLKFKNEKLNGIYVIIDANTRYKTNKIIPLDDVSKEEYPFSINLLNEGACIFLDQIKTEQCECI